MTDMGNMGGMGDVDVFDPIGHLCALPSLSHDNGINVTITTKGTGWRRPKAGDEVLISYVARELGEGRQYERCDAKKLVRLGAGLLACGLERAIVLRFGKGAQGLVTLSPAHAFGVDGRPPLVGCNVSVEYNLTVWDWNDLWEHADGTVLFRGLGQSAVHAPPAADSDKITLSLTALTLARATAFSKQGASVGVDSGSSLHTQVPATHSHSPSHSHSHSPSHSARSRSPLPPCALHDKVMRMSPEMQEKIKSAAKSLAARGGVGGQATVECLQSPEQPTLESRQQPTLESLQTLMPRSNVTIPLGCGLVEPAALEMALEHLRVGQRAEILVAQTHSFDNRDASKTRLVEEGKCVVYSVEMLEDLSADEQCTEARMSLALIRKDKGNQLFSSGRYREAIAWYGRAMALIGASADDLRLLNATTQTYCPTPIGDMVKGFEVTILLNSAAAYLKLAPAQARSNSTRTAVGGLPLEALAEEQDQRGCEVEEASHPARLALVAIDRALMLQPNSSKAFLRRQLPALPLPPSPFPLLFPLSALLSLSPPALACGEVRSIGQALVMRSIRQASVNGEVRSI
jgi:FKBP-type peptidyl-prolyl cis-trans isomerase 2